jgi:hypothetical protein
MKRITIFNKRDTFKLVNPVKFSNTECTWDFRKNGSRIHHGAILTREEQTISFPLIGLVNSFDVVEISDVLFKTMIKMESELLGDKNDTKG